MKQNPKKMAKAATWQRPPDNQHCPPRRKPPPLPPGQDFDSLTGRHGRACGPFENAKDKWQPK